MCYILFLSTSSLIDLSAESTTLVRFENLRADDIIAAGLHYSYKWYVGSKSGCSCSFRHLLTSDLGFGKPEDWFPENDGDIDATRTFVLVVRKLLYDGHRVDCMDTWHGAKSAEIVKMEVDLGGIADDEFRFFENYHFVFTKAAPATLSS